MDMEALKKPEIFCSTKLSNVELHARATLAVPFFFLKKKKAERLKGRLEFKMQSPRELLTYHIRENEVPARDEGPDLSHRHVAVKVCRACFGNPGPKFGIAQASQHGGQSGDQEAEDDSRPCFFPGDLAGKNVDTGAKGGAHSQGDEV